MDFWNDFTRKLTDAADFTVKEAEKLTGSAKIKFDIAVLEKHVEDIYTDIGKLRYDEIKNSTDNSEKILADASEIDTITERLEAMKVEYASLRNYKLCPGCGAKIDRDVMFCPKCGKPQ